MTDANYVLVRDTGGLTTGGVVKTSGLMLLSFGCGYLYSAISRNKKKDRKDERRNSKKDGRLRD